MLINSYQAELGSIAVHNTKEQRVALRVDTIQPDNTSEKPIEEDNQAPPDIQVKRRLIESLKGKDVDWYSPRASSDSRVNESDQPPSQLIEYVKRETFQAYDFSARLNLLAGDGKQLSLSADIRWQHLRIEEQLLVVPAELHDPLVLNFNAEPVTFRGTVAFDLNSDGHADTLPVPEGNAGYLIHDKNGNQLFDQSDELVGLKSGNAWQDLADIDENGNGWLDRQDSEYGALFWWQPGTAQSLYSLDEKQIEGIFLQSSATPATLYNDEAPLAQLRDTGVFIHSDNQLGIAQRFDFYV